MTRWSAQGSQAWQIPDLQVQTRLFPSHHLSSSNDGAIESASPISLFGFILNVSQRQFADTSLQPVTGKDGGHIFRGFAPAFLVATSIPNPFSRISKTCSSPTQTEKPLSTPHTHRRSREYALFSTLRMSPNDRQRMLPPPHPDWPGPTTTTWTDLSAPSSVQYPSSI